MAETIDDLQSYPILTAETGPLGPPAAAVPGAPLGRVVERAIRDVLGWRPRPGDVKGFLAALNQSFACEQIRGRTECRWVQRSYAVQADMGALTGAQASLYTRARTALEQSLPLLDGLKPLDPTADPGDLESIRAIVRSEWQELVAEIGREGGPRVARVDQLFQSLMAYEPGKDLPPTQPKDVGGHLGELRDLFGLTSDHVNTIEEEQNLTNFFVLVDYITCALRNWHDYRRAFRRNGQNSFLGTQLVWISQQLAVVAEQVQEVRYAMDSVFLGPAERQVTVLTLGVDERVAERLTIAELLDWIERFVTEEGPRLIEDGGKLGVGALLPAAKRLAHLARQAARQAAAGGENPGRGFHTPRVARALEELAGHLERLVELAQPVERVLRVVEKPPAAEAAKAQPPAPELPPEAAPPGEGPPDVDKPKHPPRKKE